jgi:hypothetical protein
LGCWGFVAGWALLGVPGRVCGDGASARMRQFLTWSREDAE